MFAAAWRSRNPGLWMAELDGKGWRVLGYFVWMLGAGMFLDSDGSSTVISLMTFALMVAGGAAFVLGAAQSLVRVGEPKA